MKNKKNPITVFFVISVFISVVSLVLLMLSRRSSGLAELINGSVSQTFRRFMATLGELAPFSLFELLLLLIPVLVALLVILLVRAVRRDSLPRLVTGCMAVAMLLWSGNALALGVGYNARSVASRIELERVEIDADSLAYTLQVLIDDVNTYAELVDRDESGVAVMGCDLAELSARICASYDSLSDKYGFYEGFSSSVREVDALHMMSYLGLIGIYTYYTGQANVNADFPDYDIAFTSAHELSHQRGIMPENQASFMAYLLCSESDDVFLNYSAALNMLEYVASALYRTDPVRYSELIAGLSPLVYADTRASRAVYDKYGDGILYEISARVNDLFLKSNGTPGTVSYSMVTELAVAYITTTR